MTDLFSGFGGSSVGLEHAGYKTVIAANHNPQAVKNHQLNHPDTEHRIANLSETDFRTFPRTNLCWASPSCVWHTPAGGRKKLPIVDELRREDVGAVDRATAFAVVQAAEVHAYEAVIVENVPEFRDWVLYQPWIGMMRVLGYRVQETVIDAYDVGAAQYRRRLFLVFTEHGAVDLSLPAAPRVHADSILELGGEKRVTRPMYITPQLEQITEDDVRHLVMYRKNARAHRADSRPLATITTSGTHHGVAYRSRGEFFYRMLSARELARGQGFPDDFQFAGTVSEIKRGIGNAVAVPVARFLGERVAQVQGWVTPPAARDLVAACAETLGAA
ncbi:MULTISPECIES: DNA cytosine methyltransferase [Brevibacterium]|uniref:DNA cytosine methyltransferase n=1 Tax=Brevibacterium TaxID=1696 RepID=UPI001C690195|nr:MULTISPECIES: DNA cytosine methyltransferase [Brevibacterium]